MKQIDTPAKTGKKETVAQRALLLLQPIRADMFVQGWYTNWENKCCALGHFNRLTSPQPRCYDALVCDDAYRWARTNPLRSASRDYLSSRGYYHVDIASVNNGEPLIQGIYPQLKIKDRVMACLKDMVAAGY